LEETNRFKVPTWNRGRRAWAEADAMCSLQMRHTQEQTETSRSGLSHRTASSAPNILIRSTIRGVRCCVIAVRVHFRDLGPRYQPLDIREPRRHASAGQVVDHHGMGSILVSIDVPSGAYQPLSDSSRCLPWQPCCGHTKGILNSVGSTRDRLSSKRIVRTPLHMCPLFYPILS
jgi:hypothetical protein